MSEQRVAVKFWHDWQFFRVNWIDFTFIRLYYERDFVTGQSEIACGLLGLHVAVIWPHARQEARGDADAR